MSPHRLPARSSILFACFAALVVGTVGVHLACRPSRVSPPRDLCALGSYLTEHGFEEYAVRPEILRLGPGENSLAGGFYLVAPSVEVDPRSLPRDRSQVRRWRGVLACSRVARADDWWRDVEAWGECGHCAAGFAFFGDPEEVAKVRTLLP
jgi:hypothetical protein